MGKLTHTVKGPIASFRSADKAPIESLKLHFLPKQEGSGDPSPTNIRPITGWTGCNLKRTGANLFDFAHCMTYHVNVSGTASDFTMTATDDAWSYLQFNVNDLIGKGTFYVSALIERTASSPQNNVGIALRYRKSDGTLTYPNIKAYTDNACNAEDAEFTIPDTASDAVINIFVHNYASGGEGMTARVRNFRITSSKNTQFEPYFGETIPISWTDHGAEYGGYVDLATGEVWKTVNLLHFQPNYIQGVIQNNIGGNAAYLALSATIGNAKGDQLIVCCDKLKSSGHYQMFDDFSAYIPNEKRLVIGLPQELNTLEAVRNWMTDIGGFDLAYLISTPSVVASIDPHQLKSFLDYNNFWSDMNDDTEVEYCFADRLSERKLILDTPHIASVSGSIASFETDMKAPIVNLKVHFAPVQSDSGNPSPSNVIPISGFSSINLFVSNEVIPITFPDGIAYGGYVDLINGKLVIDKKSIDMGDLRYTKNQNYTGIWQVTDPPSDKVAINTGLFCEIFKGANSNVLSSFQNLRITGIRKILFRNDEWDNYTEEQVINAVSGYKIVYSLTNPIEYDLTPQQLKTLLGQNNIWSDANGNIDVKYWTH